MSGVISGGWGFVWAAYLATAAVFIIYTASIGSRYRAITRRRDR